MASPNINSIDIKFEDILIGIHNNNFVWPIGKLRKILFMRTKEHVITEYVFILLEMRETWHFY